MTRRTLGELRSYASAPKHPYIITEVAGEGPLTSADIHEFFSGQAIETLQNTVFDIAQVLMRTASDKSIASMRNLVKATSERYRRKAGMLFLLPVEDDEEAKEDKALQLMIAILLDSGSDLSSDLLEQSNRDSMSPMAHGEYIVAAYDALMEDLALEHLALIVTLLDQHTSSDSIRQILQEIVYQSRASLRGYLRRFKVWV